MSIQRLNSRSGNVGRNPSNPPLTTSKIKPKPSFTTFIMLNKWRLLICFTFIFFLMMISYSHMLKNNSQTLQQILAKRKFRAGSAKTGKLFDPSTLDKPLPTFKKTDLDTLNITYSLSSNTYIAAKNRASAISKDFNVKSGELLAPLLVPRVSDTPGHAKVRDFLINKLKEYGFQVSLDQFTDSTPFGTKKFTNIVGIKNPKATNRLVLAAHYDSKYFKKGTFIGATDSSVPTALILGVCKALSDVLDSSDKTLQVIFFDGEEAFEEWTSTDSLYGSRHLATKWSSQPDSLTAQALPGIPQNELDLIDVFVLLDLIGTVDTNFVPTQQSTFNIYSQLAQIEYNLFKLGFVSKTYFQRIDRALTHMSIDDDHRPFVEKGVSALHLISNPFPKVWHTLEDNSENLNPSTITDLNLVFITFVAAYLNLPL
ncbi:hypothetical protein BB561_002618 [Smittium simulii]|uniref:Peptide hydrolase n=1 Tax=Smittium simulii TaxID=133385 RepID=A0A2T9YPV3_9FUNG|nr:hypothetical protein BB561_002618 [Smittium simulii]